MGNNEDGFTLEIGHNGVGIHADKLRFEIVIVQNEKSAHIIHVPLNKTEIETFNKLITPSLKKINNTFKKIFSPREVEDVGFKMKKYPL